MASSNTKRIFKNSLFLYFRMILLMGISFYTTRVILEALGVEDMGIYNVVGSLIMMFDFVSSGLTGATQRFLNVGLGRNDERLTNQYFSQSLIIHLVLAFSMIVLLETVGLWFVYNKLNIPAERFTAAVWCFQFSTISLGLRMIKICFESDIIAREDMSVYAYLSIFEGMAKLLVCYVIMFNSSFDRLVLYGFLILLINLCITLFNVIFCLRKYQESHFHWFNDRKVYRQLSGFLGINSFGVVSWAVGKQGIDILLNIFFGPVVNGAKGIAASLDRVTYQFSSNLQIAVRPQITKLFAQEAYDEMISLGMRSSKLIYYVSLIIAIPMLFQTEAILGVWLKEVPQLSAGFVRIMAVESLFYSIGTNFYMVTTATGKIKNTQVYGRLFTLMALPVSYFVLRLYPDEFVPSAILAFSSLLYSLYIVYDANNMLRFGLMKFFSAVIVPIVATTSLAMVAGYFCRSLVTTGIPLVDLVLNAAIICGLAVLIVFVMGINQDERKFILRLVKRKKEYPSTTISEKVHSENNPKNPSRL